MVILTHTKTLTHQTYSAMSIDFSKYSATNFKPESREWTPPVSELQMKDRSAKLAISTRCYPEYLLAAFAFLEERYKMQPNSLSELMYLIVCDFINQNQDEIGSIPSPEVAIEFFISRGFISSEHKENQRAFSMIHQKASENEERMLRNPSLTEQAKYFKDRDPEKYESIMKEIEKQFQEKLEADLSAEPEEKKAPKPQESEEEETISTEHKTFEQLLEDRAEKKAETDLAQKVDLSAIEAIPEKGEDNEQE